MVTVGGLSDYALTSALYDLRFSPITLKEARGTARWINNSIVVDFRTTLLGDSSGTVLEYVLRFIGVTQFTVSFLISVSGWKMDVGGFKLGLYSHY